MCSWICEAFTIGELPCCCDIIFNDQASARVPMAQLVESDLVQCNSLPLHTVAGPKPTLRLRNTSARSGYVERRNRCAKLHSESRKALRVSARPSNARGAAVNYPNWRIPDPAYGRPRFFSFAERASHGLERLQRHQQGLLRTRARRLRQIGRSRA